MAKKAAEKSQNTKNGQYRLGAVVIEGNKVVSTGYNRYHFNPYLYSKYGYHTEHAELVSLRRRKDKNEGDTIVVARINKKGNFVNSCPCEICQRVLLENNIKNVYYTNENGDLDYMKLCA